MNPTVQSRAKAKKKKKSRTVQQGQKARIRLPSARSPAVMITLQTDAAAKGVTYADVLERAADRVDLSEIGLEGGMKIRRSVTGARLLELPKAPPEKAEKLAAKLRTVLDGVADVVRPVKRMAIKVKGLDDSATKEKVAAAICRVANCSDESIQVGEIRRGNGAMGVTIVKCPVDAAKLLLDSGRLLVGWSSAGIDLLEERPMRCFRCQELGHTRALCPSAADRSTVCYRCGVAGHNRANCSGVLRCAICADLGLSAGHELGSRACKAPKKRGKNAGSSPASRSGVRSQAPDEEVMSQ